MGKWKKFHHEGENLDQPKMLPEGKRHSLPSAETNLWEILNPDTNLWRKIDFSIDWMWEYEAIEVSWERLWMDKWFVDRKFFFSDKWKNLKWEMEQKWYKQPTKEEFSKIIEWAWWIKKFDELLWWSLSIPWVRLDIDLKTRCRPFAVNNPYFKIFRDWIVYDGYKQMIHRKSVKIWEDKYIPWESRLEDFSYLYRDHEKWRVLFIKKK